jgi:hypothetical protein
MDQAQRWQEEEVLKCRKKLRRKQKMGVGFGGWWGVGCNLEIDHMRQRWRKEGRKEGRKKKRRHGVLM